MRKYKAIVFDMGNVIMDFSPDYVLSQFTQDSHEINLIRNALFFSPLWSKADQGEVSDSELLEKALYTLGESYRELVTQILNTWYHYKTCSLGMLRIIKRLKETGYKLYLCSNVAASFYQYEKEVEAFSYLDGKVISSDIHLTKPDKAYFDYFFEKYRLNPAECFFIDDSQENIKAASLCGMDGYWYNGNSELLERYLKGVNMIHG